MPSFCQHPQEPSVITAGQTLAWTVSFSQYPASTSGTLSYALQAPNQPLITIVAAASGDAYAVSVADTVTAAYAPGCYLWTSYLENAGVRTIVARGSLTILPSPLAALGTTHASRMLALIEAALEGRIPNGLESTNIDGQELHRIPVADLSKLHERYQAKVAAELRAARARAGLRVQNTIGIRFTRP